MGLLDDVETYFCTKCLYKVLGVSKDANEKQLKKAYYLSSLKYHPDRSQDDDDKEERKCKFQVLSRVHEVLSNPEQRSCYDETGELLDESDICMQDKNWDTYWRILFKKISKKDIEEFENEYKGSEEEKDSIKMFYQQFEGNIELIMENVMCATFDDEDRICSIIQTCIDNGELSEFDAFNKEANSKKRKRRKKGEKEAKEAEKHAEDIGLNTNGNLSDLILRRQGDREKEFNSFLSNMEAKYATSKKGVKRNKSTAKKAKNKPKK